MPVASTTTGAWPRFEASQYCWSSRRYRLSPISPSVMMRPLLHSRIFPTPWELNESSPFTVSAPATDTSASAPTMAHIVVRGGNFQLRIVLTARRALLDSKAHHLE